MILTITPDAHVERTFVVNGLTLGSELKAEEEVVMPAGVGVSASLVLKELRAPTFAAGLIAGFNGDFFLDLLDHLHVPNQFFHCSGETPTAFHLVEFDRRRETHTRSNTMFGLPEHADRLTDLIERQDEETTCVLLGGSLISGLPMDTFGKWIDVARRMKKWTVFHPTGRGLSQGVASKPDVIRLGREDLLKLDPSLQGSFDSVEGLASRLETQLGVWAQEAIVILLASHIGLAVTRQGVFRAVAEEVPFVNRSGVEEAFTAGLTWGYLQKRDWPEALRLGLASASATILQVGKAVCRYKDVMAILPTVEVEDLSLR